MKGDGPQQEKEWHAAVAGKERNAIAGASWFKRSVGESDVLVAGLGIVLEGRREVVQESSREPGPQNDNTAKPSHHHTGLGLVRFENLDAWGGGARS